MAGTDSADPIANAVLSENSSRFFRLALQAALSNPSPPLPPEYINVAQALLANVIMNDVLNWWNEDLLQGGDAVQTSQTAFGYADQVINSTPPPSNSVLALAYHARGLAKRTLKDPQGALNDFEQAVRQDGNFARAYAQVGNQKTLNGRLDPHQDNPHGDFKNAKDLNPNHPANAYFDWGEGRLYFVEACSDPRPDWSNAIGCLKSSIKALSGVWYNYVYLAAAQDAAHQSSDAGQTMTDFSNNFTNLGKDPKAMLQRAATVLFVANPTTPGETARRKVYDFLRSQGVA
jgi:tetratricopeptide (TPR) repeat protein